MKIFGRKNSGEMNSSDNVSNSNMNRNSDQNSSRHSGMSYSGDDSKQGEMWQEPDGGSLKNNDRGGSRNGSNFG